MDDFAGTKRFLDLIAWVNAHRKQVTLGACIVLVAALAIGAIVYNMTQREARASAALSEIQTFVNGKEVPPRDLVPKYRKVAEEFPGTEAAARALLLAAEALYADGQYREARQQFEQITTQYPQSVFVPEAMFGVAACLQAEGKVDEAVAKYEELRRRYASAAVIPQVNFNLAMLYERQGKAREAYQLYDELVQAEQFSGLGAEAGMRRADLLEQHPELAQTNPPPAATALSTNLITQMLTSQVASVTGTVATAASNVAAQGSNLLKTATNLLLQATQAVPQAKRPLQQATNLLKAVPAVPTPATQSPSGKGTQPKAAPEPKPGAAPTPAAAVPQPKDNAQKPPSPKAESPKP